MKLPQYWNRVWINWVFAALLLLVAWDIPSPGGSVVGIAIALLFLNGVLWGEQ